MRAKVWFYNKLKKMLERPFTLATAMTFYMKHSTDAL